MSMTEYEYRRNKQLKAGADIVKKRVLTIYTGGTVGMVDSPNGKLYTVRRTAALEVLQRVRL